MLKKWRDSFNARSDLHERQDGDLELYNLENFELTDLNGNSVPDAHNITSNKPKTYANRVKGALETGDMQVQVTKLDGSTDDNCARIEEMLREVLYPLIDQYLALKQIPPLLEVLAGQITLMGSIAGLIYPFKDSGNMIPHVLPWDFRWVTHGYGSEKGFSFAGYQTIRTKEMIEDEYDYDSLGTNVEEAEVTDIWTPGKHEIWISGKNIEDNYMDSNEHNLGYTPVPIHKCSVNIWHRSEGWEKYEGESVYAENRDLYTGYNTFLTILNTLTIRAFTAGLQFRNRAGAEAMIEGNPRRDNVINAINLDEAFDYMPVNDIKNAAIMLREILEQDIIFGSLPLMEYGEMSDQETVAQITTKSSKTASVLKPRRRPIELWYDDMARLLLLQIEQKGLPHQVTLMGSTTKFDFYPLGDYLIKHKLNVISPQQDIANAALAQAYERYLDLETILEKIIQVDDVTSILEKKEKENVERMIPRVVALRQATKLLKSKDDKEKAEGTMIALELGLGQEEQVMGQNQPPVTEKGQGNPIMELFRGG